MEHQYPGPISGDEHMLAELMLPDQAHVRSQDWTIFFLHKDTAAEEEAREERREKRRETRERRKWRRKARMVMEARRRRRRMEAGESGVGENGRGSEDEDDVDALSDIEDMLGGDEDGLHNGENGPFEDESDSDSDTEAEEEEQLEGPPLIYVLNLVNTKQDNTVKRGAVVKAMAICTRHSFLHIYKPLLLLALEEYFKAPVPETLESLYNALNSMDLSLMPRLSLLERFILQASDAKDMFIEKFEQMIQQRMAEDAERRSMLSSNSSQQSPSRPSTQKYALPRDTHEFESKVLYNGIPVPIKVPTAISPETVGDFSIVKLIQTFSNPHASSPQPFALHPHLTTSGAFTHPIIVLVNALLTQKRIMFLGHNRPSGEVAEAVLAACALASGGLLRGFTRHAFPYTDLTKIDDLLKVPGFIAGVTNPAFANKAEWWDLLCDLPTGRMKISHRIESAPVTDGLLYFQQHHLPGLGTGTASGAGGSGHLYNFPHHGIGGGSTKGGGGSGGSSSNSGPGGVGADADVTGDNAFMESLLHSISQRHGEGVIRAKWRDWVLKFTRIAAAFEELVYGASALYIGALECDSDAGGYGVGGHGYVWPDDAARTRELAGNVYRVEGWRNSRSYYSFVQDCAHLWTKRPVRDLDFAHHHDRLRFLRLSHDQSAAVYLAFARAVDEAGDRAEAAAAAAMVASTTSPASAEGPSAVSQPQQLSQRALDRLHAQARYDVVNQLLTSVPEASNAGLFYVALGLFHPKPEARAAVVRLMDAIIAHPAGRHYWAALGRFAKLAYLRIKQGGSGEMGPQGLGGGSGGAAMTSGGAAVTSAGAGGSWR
ncbi:docking domain of Afi1 for Arf3 in vesicle trafficking-domain-containing protein [Lineolata rhizophorae]|uniref:Docking domain of Afi1 for Arf3 in vesicle trafficking-domain-containing protein n=1 Tax=Lineolata rhizophorae TaxID=578093 RepID=A0A6A6PBA9_9PEZI|nr:docking domain of Afi1 for Arf3 in vesicle trafficking-domain-containing protein [Lineolata rhizophorae]